jgi:deoxyribonuclease V
MIACVDVDYRGPGACAACVLLGDWADADSAGEEVEHLGAVAPYQPGAFYRRELPCLLAVLARVRDPLDAVVVDGYVWLGGGTPGLGAHLHEALGRAVPVVGEAAAGTFGDRPRDAARPAAQGSAGVSAGGSGSRPGSRQPCTIPSPPRRLR